MMAQKSIVLILVCLLAACGPGEPPPAPSTESTRQAEAVSTAPAGAGITPAVEATVLGATPIQTPVAAQESVGESPSPSVSSEAVTGEPVITFNRSGGFAGLNQTFLIYADGRIVDSNGEERQVSPEQVAAVLKQIEAGNFFDLGDSYLPADTCCDRFSYEITVQTPTQTKTVVTMDGVENRPEGLTMTLTAITELLSSVGM